MRIVDLASITHPGRVRRNNEDSHLVAPPLFVVADGMGGAQAGELASRICIDVFRELGPLDGEEPKARLRRVIEEANLRILERGREDPSAAGMGSTVTAALVADRQVAFGHVGDSRAYLLRRGRLQQLSRDHSLVAELVRQGRITEAEASAHPQRSVITRVLGAAETVDVDTWDVEPEADDVYLICSDGLTALVDDDDVAAGLARQPLAAALRGLVQAANAAGGDDNITAVAFRLGVDEGESNGAAADATAVTPPVLEEDTLTEADRVPVVQASASSAPVRRLVLEEAPQRRRPWRLALAVLVPLVLTVGAVAAAVAGLRYAHFIGVDPKTGEVSVFQGVPVELGGGHTLYRLTFRSRVPAAALSQAERRKLFDHTIRSESDALRLVRRLEAAQP